MPLRLWFVLIGVVVGLGCLQVAQHNAVFMKGYAVGERTRHLHAQQTDVSWLNVQVAGLSSPAHLAQVARDRRLNLVAWSTLASNRVTATDVASGREPSAGQTLMAALDRDSAAGDDSSD